MLFMEVQLIGRVRVVYEGAVDRQGLCVYGGAVDRQGLCVYGGAVDWFVCLWRCS